MTRRTAVVALAALAASGCGGSMNDPGANHGPFPFTNVPAPDGGVAQFSMLPVAIAPGKTLTALGNLAPPGPVLPTNHVYFYDWDLSRGNGPGTDVRAVFMPARGAVIAVIPGNGDTGLMFRATSTFYFSLGHVVLTSPLVVGQILDAGAQIGTTGVGATLDLGAFDETAVHTGFVNRSRYGEQTLFYVSPWAYFTPDLQSQLPAHMYRAATAPRDGMIDFDVAGRLSGNWFLTGMPVDSTEGPYGWPRSISFAYDYFDPTLVRISIGGTIGPAGVFAIDPVESRPNSVSVASGLVRYALYAPFDAGFPPTGYLLVQMRDDATIEVELFSATAAQTTAFDSAAAIFIR